MDLWIPRWPEVDRPFPLLSLSQLCLFCTFEFRARPDFAGVTTVSVVRDWLAIEMLFWV
jgi:hypothetical protein